MTQQTMTKEQILAAVTAYYTINLNEDLCYNAMDKYAQQEVAKEREKYDKLYLEFEEVCRQVQINKDRCGRYEEAYHKEFEKAKKLVEALKEAMDDPERNTDGYYLSIEFIKQSLTEYEKL